VVVIETNWNTANIKIGSGKVEELVKSIINEGVKSKIDTKAGIVMWREAFTNIVRSLFYGVINRLEEKSD